MTLNKDFIRHKYLLVKSIRGKIQVFFEVKTFGNTGAVAPSSSVDCFQFKCLYTSVQLNSGFLGKPRSRNCVSSRTAGNSFM